LFEALSRAWQGGRGPDGNGRPERSDPMDFRMVLERLLGAFEARGIRYALMGGFALGLWGAPRSTVGMDFLADREDMPRVHEILSGLGYDRVYHSENVSQYSSPLAVFGEIDFLHAFREISLGMLARAVQKPIFQGRQAIRVLVPEDIIGLKVQAMANNPSRKAADLSDIESLMEMHGRSLDWDRISGYFDAFGWEALATQLKERHGAGP